MHRSVPLPGSDEPVFGARVLLQLADPEPSICRATAPQTLPGRCAVPDGRSSVGSDQTLGLAYGDLRARVLVTGGTGVLGKPLVEELLRRGHEVRVLSRSANPTVPSGASAVQGDVRTGAGLQTAVEKVDAVVHAATSPFRRAKSTEVDGTRNVRDVAVASGTPHVLYVSIVGVDRLSARYYKAKWAAEQVVEQTEGSWTLQRITQFHDLIDRFLGLRVFPRTANLSFQPIDVTDAGRRLADLLDVGPQGRVNDVGGPEVLSVRELRDQRRAVTGRRTLLVPAPALGPLRELDAGHHLAPEARYGTKTWKQWLSEHAAR